MPQVEEIRTASPPPAPWPEPWPSPWPDAPPATMPPAWYYPPPWWATPPAEDPPARHGQGYGSKAAAPGAPDQENPRQYLVSLPAVLNVHQAAEYLKVCDEVVYTLVHREDFPGFRIGRVWRIDAQRLGEWIQRQIEK